jgi:hypothetical protein
MPSDSLLLLVELFAEHLAMLVLLAGLENRWAAAQPAAPYVASFPVSFPGLMQHPPNCRKDCWPDAVHGVQHLTQGAQRMPSSW